MKDKLEWEAVASISEEILWLVFKFRHCFKLKTFVYFQKYLNRLPAVDIYGYLTLKCRSGIYTNRNSKVHGGNMAHVIWVYWNGIFSSLCLQITQHLFTIDTELDTKLHKFIWVGNNFDSPLLIRLHQSKWLTRLRAVIVVVFVVVPIIWVGGLIPLL